MDNLGKKTDGLPAVISFYYHVVIARIVRGVISTHARRALESKLPSAALLNHGFHYSMFIHVYKVL
jgi:hypothetical protein